MTVLNLDGLTPLPVGKLAAIVTHLSLAHPTVAPPMPAEPGFVLDAIRPHETGRYRALFLAVGEPWLWFSRLRLCDDALRATLAEPGRAAYAVLKGGQEIGLVELDASDARETELAFFGLVPAATGMGLGRRLMQAALAHAFERPIERVTVHTCTLDDPRALGFYRRMGFVAERQEIEIVDDPRLNGLMRREAAPHIPVFQR